MFMRSALTRLVIQNKKLIQNIANVSLMFTRSALTRLVIQNKKLIQNIANDICIKELTWRNNGCFFMFLN